LTLFLEKELLNNNERLFFKNEFSNSIIRSDGTILYQETKIFRNFNSLLKIFNSKDSHWDVLFVERDSNLVPLKEIRNQLYQMYNITPPTFDNGDEEQDEEVSYQTRLEKKIILKKKHY
jgi:hypothetical protein